MSIDTAHYRTLLLEERERVARALENLDHPGRMDEELEELGTAQDNHLADTATATLDREIDYTLEENSGRLLAEIDAALRADRGRHVRHVHEVRTRDLARAARGVSVGLALHRLQARQAERG